MGKAARLRRGGRTRQQEALLMKNSQKKSGPLCEVDKNAKSAQGKRNVQLCSEHQIITRPIRCGQFVQIVPLIPWGGYLKDTGTRLTNTCNFDTTLQCLVALYAKVPALSSFMLETVKSGKIPQGFLDAIILAEKKHFNAAKLFWIRDVIKANPTSKVMDMNASELDNAFKYLGRCFPIKKFHRCSNDECLGAKKAKFYSEQKSSQFEWEHSDIGELLISTPFELTNYVGHFVQYDVQCSCGSPRLIRHEFNFSYRPFLFYPLLTYYDMTKNFDERKLPRIQVFGDRIYDVFAYTCVKMDSVPANGKIGLVHFVVKFILGTKFIVYDGRMQHPTIEYTLPGDKVTSVWLVPKVEEDN